MSERPSEDVRIRNEGLGAKAHQRHLSDIGTLRQQDHWPPEIAQQPLQQAAWSAYTTADAPKGAMTYTAQNLGLT